MSGHDTAGKEHRRPGRGLRIARAALTRLMEPSDLPGMALIRALGPEEALAFIRWQRTPPMPRVERQVTELLSEAGTERWPGWPRHWAGGGHGWPILPRSGTLPPLPGLAGDS